MRKQCESTSRDGGGRAEEAGLFWFRKHHPTHNTQCMRPHPHAADNAQGASIAPVYAGFGTSRTVVPTVTRKGAEHSSPKVVVGFARAAPTDTMTGRRGECSCSRLAARDATVSAYKRGQGEEGGAGDGPRQRAADTMVATGQEGKG